MELNYASIINAGQGLVGNLQEQMMMQDQRKQQQQVRALQVQQAQQTQARQGAFNARLAQITQSQRYGDIPGLMLEFPDYADQLKPGYDALSKDAKARNLTQMGTITRRATAGDVTGAIDMLRSRVEADKAAGEDTSEEEDAIRMLSSEDPMQRQAAISTLHILTYNADPDGYKALFPADAKSGWKKEYDDRVATFGKAAADQWAATQDEKFIPVQAGGSVFRASDLMGGGGIVATPEQQAESERVRAMFPNAPEFATDNPRGGDPSTGMGGVPAPALGSNGLPATLTPQQYQAIVNVKGKAATDAYLSQNGIAVENIARGGTAQQPVRVRSVQEARKLPSGTEFITPDGRTMRKP